MKAVWCCSTCGAVYHKDYPRCPNDGGEVVASSVDPLLDKTIGHYVVDRLVGEGGMGRVYEAHHATLANKRYAVKVLLGDAGATPSMRKRFAREAESASKLVHPNVVGVTDYGATSGGLPFIVMDFVDGRSLDTLIDEGPIEPARVIKLARAVCEGLAYAHAAGVVHRDLKPANIIITADGTPRIADFGLAQQLDDNDIRLTSTGMAMGTPAYAAPEQMAGKRVSHRADLYALGMTMFEMCSGGVLPFKGGPLDVATAKAHRDPPRFSEVCPDIAIPPGLEALIVRLMKRRAADRPMDCAEVIAELDALAGEVTIGRRTPMRIARRRAAWLVPAVAGVAVAGGAAWFALADHSSPEKVAAAVPLDPAPPVVRVEPAPVDPALAPPPPVVDPPPVPAKVAAPAPRHHKHHAEPPKPVAPPAPPPVMSPVVATVKRPEPVPAPPPPPPAPVVLHAAITGVDVDGSLPAADVRRAVDRALPAIEHCMPTAAQAVVAQLTIGENRRAENVRASGGGAANCVGAALAGVRTESAPDVGEVAVTVHVRFAEKQ